MNTAIQRNSTLGPSLDNLNTPNLTGFFRSYYYTQREGGGTKKCTAYDVTTPGSILHTQPEGNTQWNDTFCTDAPKMQGT